MKCCPVHAGVAIPGDPAAIEGVGAETDAQAIFVIEKEASFQVRQTLLIKHANCTPCCISRTTAAIPEAAIHTNQMFATFDMQHIQHVSSFTKQSI